jgi:CRP-like cAMP-binding protein
MTKIWEPFQGLFTYFEQFVNFTEEEKIGFASLLTLKSYKKGEIITEIGTIEKNLSFISSGIVRGYCLKGNDDVTCFIEFSNAFISAYSSFTQQLPSIIGLEALTNVTVFQMQYENLQCLYSSSKEGERMGRFAAERMFAELDKRIVDMLTKTALERYEELLANEPHLILTIPQKYVAEYLGIKPESLSRIKKQLMV